jgi:tRNA-2-methylthio-N6-dimethylallyladenosine synthase
MLAILAGFGYCPAVSQDEADLLIFNTCSVRFKAENKLYSMLGRFKDLKKFKPRARIIVAGCVAQQEGEKLLRRLPFVDLVMGPDAWPDLPDLLAELDKGRRLAQVELKGQKEMPPREAAAQVVAQVAVMRGCNNFCSYCIVPYVRGREVSRSCGDILREAATLAEAGARQVNLLGQNVNSYRDPSGLDFADLLNRVAEIPGLWRIGFTTSHPKDLSPRLMAAMAAQPKIIKQLHLPAQSGSDRVLAAMNRGYSRSHYLSLVRELRRQIPAVALGGDIIVGFPGESRDDFQRTMDLLEEVNYDFLFSFIYSDRPGTTAARLAGKIDGAEKNRRIVQLQTRQKQISLARRQALVGHTVQVLVEGPAKKGAGVSGRDQWGRTVNFPGQLSLQGSLVTVKLTAAGVNSLRGQMC